MRDECVVSCLAKLVRLVYDDFPRDFARVEAEELPVLICESNRPLDDPRGRVVAPDFPQKPRAVETLEYRLDDDRCLLLSDRADETEADLL